MSFINPKTLIKNERVIHSIKTALAVFIGIIIIKTTHLDQWLIITIVVVMCAQVNVGSMLQKSVMRLFGTITGSLIATFTLLLFGDHTVATPVVITLSVALFSYLATSQSRFSESGTLGAATTIIILINQDPTVLLGLRRTLEIILGIGIAAGISQFVLPMHARVFLRRDQIDTIKKLKALYAENFLTKYKDPAHNEHVIMDEQIIKLLITQRKLALDAAREPFAKKSLIVKRFSELLVAEREILRAMDFMHHAFQHSAATIKIFSSEQMLHDFHEKVVMTFDQIAEQLKNHKKTITISLPTLQALRDTIKAHQNPAENDLTYINSFLFCTEILLEKLKELIHLIQK